jgi:phosphoserine phosphatase RsbU/P
VNSIDAQQAANGNAGERLAILMLEDNPLDAELLEARLEEAAVWCELTRAHDETSFTDALAARCYDVILCDYKIPGFDGPRALEAAQRAWPDVPVLIVSGALGEDKAVDILKRGATDYVLKDRLDRFIPSLRRALREAHEKAERKRAELALKESERALNTLMSNMPGMAFRRRPEDTWVFEYASAGAKALSGYRPEDFYPGGNTTWTALVHPDDVGRITAEAQVAFSEQRQLTVTYRIRSRGGEEKWVWERSVAVLGDDGSVQRIEGFVTDITEAKKRADFEQQLIGIVSHDLRNPLQVILMAASGALYGQELDPRTTTALVRIQSAGERAIRMIRDLLDFTHARLGSGIPIEARSLNFDEHVHAVVDELQHTHAERELRCVHQGAGVGEWDIDRIAQLVTNLVVNALKYSPDGTPVTVTTRGESDVVVLEVHNRGEPIDPGRLPTIFKPLNRDKMDVQTRSIGLGLYIVDHIVRAHGGTVEATSSFRDGTRFIAKLPRVPPSRPPSSLPTSVGSVV